MDSVYNIFADDQKFIVTKATLLNFPNSLLPQLIKNNHSDECVVVDGNNIYIDRDPKSFLYVIDTYRKYPVDVEDIQDDLLKKKVMQDLKHFKLYKETVSLNYNQNIFSNDDECDNEDEDVVDKILKTSDDKINDDESNVVTNFLSKLISQKNKDTNTSSRSLQIGGNNRTSINTDVLKTDNEKEINSFIKSINSKINSENSIDIIRQLSTDHNMINLIRRNNALAESSESLSDLKELEGFSASGGGIVDTSDEFSESEDNSGLPNSLPNSEITIEYKGDSKIMKRFYQLN